MRRWTAPSRVHTTHREAKSTSNILSSKRDRYMLSTCDAAGPQFVVVDLCDDIRIDTVQPANFKFFFMACFESLRLVSQKTFGAAHAEGWSVVGRDVRREGRVWGSGEVSSNDAVSKSSVFCSNL